MNLQKSRESIAKIRASLPSEIASQFTSIINYTRLDLTTYLVLDMVKVSESIIHYDILKTYLPQLFKHVLSPERMLEILHEDKSDFICDFRDGVVYSKDTETKSYLDYLALSIEQGRKEEEVTMSDRYNKILSGDISSLYDQQKFCIEDYIRDNAKKVSDDFDIYDRYDVPTAATITRQKMDKSLDEYNM